MAEIERTFRGRVAARLDAIEDRGVGQRVRPSTAGVEEKRTLLAVCPIGLCVTVGGGTAWSWTA
jgi:hypothetical protein